MKKIMLFIAISASFAMLAQEPFKPKPSKPLTNKQLDSVKVAHQKIADKQKADAAIIRRKQLADDLKAIGIK